VCFCSSRTPAVACDVEVRRLYMSCQQRWTPRLSQNRRMLST
jgi:hypothetical protein